MALTQLQQRLVSLVLALQFLHGADVLLHREDLALQRRVFRFQLRILEKVVIIPFKLPVDGRDRRTHRGQDAPRDVFKEARPRGQAQNHRCEDRHDQRRDQDGLHPAGPEIFLHPSGASFSRRMDTPHSASIRASAQSGRPITEK